MKFSNQACLFLLITALLLMCPSYSYAYIDPGTGSYVIQIIIAGFVAGSFAVKLYWRKITGVIRKVLKKSDAHE